MNNLGTRSVAGWIALSLAGLLAMGWLTHALAQRETANANAFQRREGYEEARYGAQDIVVRTRTGNRTMRVSFSKLRVVERGRMVPVKLPGPGLALIQYTAGQGKFAAGAESFAPLEGEWLRLPLAAEFSIGTDDDTVLADMIVVEERGR